MYYNINITMHFKSTQPVKSVILNERGESINNL